MSSRVDIWKYSVLDEANRQSLEREHAEADFRRCLRMYKFGDVAARVEKLLNLTTQTNIINCKVKDAEGN